MKAPVKSKIRKIFENELDGPISRWRNDAWKSETTPIESSDKWLYKTIECHRWWLDLKTEIDRSHRGEIASRTAQHLFDGVACNLANCYRGIWVAEVFESGVRTLEISRNMARIIERALVNLEAISQNQGRRSNVDSELKKELFRICDDMIEIYEVHLNNYPVSK